MSSVVVVIVIDYGHEQEHEHDGYSDDTAVVLQGAVFAINQRPSLQKSASSKFFIDAHGLVLIR